MIGFAVALWWAGVAAAQPNWPNRSAELETVLRNDANEAGLTLEDVIDQRLWELVRHPLSPTVLSQMDDTVHRVPHRGVQFELLTPGDFGATLHIRW